MEDTELISFQIITNVGEAKSALFESLNLAREEKFKEAEKKVEEAESFMLKAHEIHFSLVQQEAMGNSVQISLLLMHAEDQLMNLETLKACIKEMILIHKKYSK